ncbi:MAG: hypothetical protein ACKVQT_02185, partial [Burkholderiales bacterium]
QAPSRTHRKPINPSYSVNTLLTKQTPPSKISCPHLSVVQFLKSNWFVAQCATNEPSEADHYSGRIHAVNSNRKRKGAIEGT